MVNHLFTATKVLNPGKGYPCIYRNWRADTHCRLWHGYDLIFSATFECEEVDLTKEGWVIDFGSFSKIKERLDAKFDHKWIVAEDDPMLDLTKIYVETCNLNGHDVGELVIVPHVSTEYFAAWMAVEATELLQDTRRLGPVRIREANCYESESNSGGFIP